MSLSESIKAAVLGGELSEADALAAIEEAKKMKERHAIEARNAAIVKIQNLAIEHGLHVEGKIKGKKAPVKYRCESGEWSGRGRTPKWLQDKLDAGAKLEDFEVKPVVLRDVRLVVDDEPGREALEVAA